MTNSTTKLMGKILAAAVITVAGNIEAACCRTTSSCAARTATTCCRRTCTTTVKIGGCCKKVWWDRYPRPELNPPEDIATLPEREQRCFVKAFELVPEQVKVKSTQNYAGRMRFRCSQQYASITNKLAVKLARSGRMLAQEPAISAADVMKMCDDTITYGRSLVMGRMDCGSFADLARQYGFKGAIKVVEAVEDTKNFRRGLASGYPRENAECRDFEALARAVNPAQWNSFLERLASLNATYDARNGTKAACTARPASKRQTYDRYSERTARALPEDIATLPNRMQLRLGKMFDLLPVQVLAFAGRDYRQRAEFLAGDAYGDIRRTLAARLKKESKRLSAAPQVTAEEVLELCDEMVRFGRPLTVGDMRDVSLAELARRYGFREVERFIDKVEDDKYSKRGDAWFYPRSTPEFRDFETLATSAFTARWRSFLARL